MTEFVLLVIVGIVSSGSLVNTDENCFLQEVRFFLIFKSKEVFVLYICEQWSYAAFSFQFPSAMGPEHSLIAEQFPSQITF